MPPLVWLVLALAAAAAAYLVGWPAMSAHRAREARDTNSERYLAWRGRGTRGPRMREGPTAEERRRIVIGAGLAVAAGLALIAFFVTS